MIEFFIGVLVGGILVALVKLAWLYNHGYADGQFDAAIEFENALAETPVPPAELQKAGAL